MGAILKVTALFLGLFLVQLLVYGIHELAESGVIHGSQAFHDATEQFGPDGPHRARALVLAVAGAAAVRALGAPGEGPVAPPRRRLTGSQRVERRRALPVGAHRGGFGEPLGAPI